jgi:hypothetical protein
MPNSLKELVWRNSTKMGPVPRAITNYIDLARKDALSRNLAPLMGKPLEYRIRDLTGLSFPYNGQRRIVQSRHLDVMSRALGVLPTQAQGRHDPIVHSHTK